MADHLAQYRGLIIAKKDAGSVTVNRGHQATGYFNPARTGTPINPKQIALNGPQRRLIPPGGK